MPPSTPVARTAQSAKPTDPQPAVSLADIPPQPQAERQVAEPKLPSVDRDLHEQIFIQMVGNMDTVPPVANSGDIARLDTATTNRLKHIRGLSERAAFIFHNP